MRAKKKKESFTLSRREMLTGNSWLDIVIKQKKESGEWRAGFFSPAVFFFFFKEYIKIWVVWESRGCEHQRLLQARWGGAQGGGRRGSTSLQPVVPTKEKKRLGERERQKRRGKEREGSFTSEKGTWTWQSLIKAAVSRRHDRLPLQTTIITTEVVAS